MIQVIGVNCLGVGTMDIVDQDKAKVLTLYWNLLRYYFIKKVAQKAEVDDE